MYYKPSIFQACQELIAAESTRHGGISRGAYRSLNLGLNTKDTPENVLANQNLFFQSLNIDSSRVVLNHQVHGAEILKASEPGKHQGYDALISNQANVFLTITVADCTPILLYDPVQRAFAAVHAGWKGTRAFIVKKTVQALATHFACQTQNILAYIGTCIDECSFEVDADVADQFEAPFKRWDAQKGKFFIDLKRANQSQLLDMGVPTSNIEISPRSTVLNNENYFSYRKDKGLTGRMMVVIGIEK